MKPQKLILGAWGPYKDRVEIDFSKLQERGVFLITGPTGAGKTTLFDAITYALYGNMSGGQREKSSVRSDFAKSTEVTFVEFFMEHGGEAYHILRNPEYMRPKKRQSGPAEMEDQENGKNNLTREKESALLTMPNGRRIEGAAAVNRKLQEILVLDYRQFKQISMIAQGEFARLLVAPSSEKTKIFREIFATSLYDRFAGLLKANANELYKQVMEFRHRIDEEIHLFQSGNEQTQEQSFAAGSGIPEMIAYLKEYLQNIKKCSYEQMEKYEAAEREGERIGEQIREAQQGNELLKSLKEAKEREALCRREAESIKVLAEEVKMARAAAVLQGDYDKWQREAQLFKEQEVKEQHLLQEITSLEEQRRLLFPYQEDREKLRMAYVQKRQREEIEKLLAEAKKCVREKVVLLEERREAYLEIEQLTMEKKNAYDQADLLYKRAAVGIAARLLRDGEPCPVCGSLEHPQAAVLTDEIPDEERLSQMKIVYEEWEGRRMVLHESVASCRGELLEMQKKEESLFQKQAEAQKQWEVLPAVILEIAENLLEKQWLEKLAFFDKLSVQSAEKKETLHAILEEQNAQKERMQSAFSQMTQKLFQGGFASVEAFLACRRDETFTEESERRIVNYENRLEGAKSILLHLEKEAGGIGEVDIAPLLELQQKNQEEKKNLLKEQTLCSHKQREGGKILKSLKDRYKKLTQLEDAYGVVRDLDNMASGSNAKRLVFEQYVLAGYFEEILNAANIRLAKMTGGRFALYRAAEVSDGRTKDNLEMNVLDFYTGKYRSVKTLSGGESFKASLSLALGMSDVIQAYSGGIRVDALFIDEGFGSLDMESLDQACETLLSLAEKERMIGIISHVPELAEKIPNRIEVKKTKVGSSVKVMVY